MDYRTKSHAKLTSHYVSSMFGKNELFGVMDIFAVLSGMPVKM